MTGGDDTTRERAAREGDGAGRFRPLDLHGGEWRIEVAVRCTELEHQLTVAETLAGADGTLRRQHLDAVRHSLDDAAEAIDPGRTGRRPIREWWSGNAVTAAWESVHDAEAELAEVATDDYVRAALPRLRSWMRDVMAPADRAPYEARFDAMQKPGAPIDRAAVREAYRQTIAENNDMHAGQRAFRNLLFTVSAALALVLLGLGVWHAIHPAAVSLCSDAGGTTGATRCFGGGAQPHGGSVLEVEAVGALGGLLGVAFLLTRFRKAPSRYNLLAAQAVLKPVAGAATALVGVLLLLSGLLVAPADLSTASMLAYAAIFGFSQELLTRFVDRHAESLLGAGAQSSGDAKPDVEALRKLDELRDAGVLTDEESAAGKRRLLAGSK